MKWNLIHITLRFLISAFSFAVNLYKSSVSGSAILSIRYSTTLTFHALTADIKGVKLNFPDGREIPEHVAISKVLGLLVPFKFDN